MNFRFASIALTMLFIGPALAQTDDALLIFEMRAPAPLAGAGPVDQALAGDEFLLSFAVRNRADQPITMRRIGFRAALGIEVVDPNVDRIDNDRDGLVDEGDEGFTRADDDARVWRIDESIASIPSGGSIERAIKVRVPSDAEAGNALALTMIAAASTEQTTLRAVQAVEFATAAPTLAATLDGSISDQAWPSSATPLLRVTAAIPSGRVTNFGLAAKGSPAIAGYTDVRVQLGDGIQCEGEASPIADGRSLDVALGSCTVIPDSDPADRFVVLEAKTQLNDADPFAEDDVIAARRAVRVAVAMTRGDDVIEAPLTVSGRLTGPLIGGRLLSVLEQPVEAGDEISATYRLVNRGDAATDGLLLKLEANGAIDCKSLSGEDSKQRRNVCTDGLLLERMAPNSLLDIDLTGRLRDDAYFDAKTALNLTARAANIVPTALPPAKLTLRLPDPPTVKILPESEWNTDGEIITARIGDAGSVQIDGTVSEGRSDASLRLMTRLVDAQTGEPIGPAPLRAESFDFKPSEGIEISLAGSKPILSSEDGWSIISLPLGILDVPISEQKDRPSYSATVQVSLRDLPELQAGRVIEIAASLDSFGDSALRGDDWAEVLIVEPSLDLTMRSPDDDRIIDLHDTVRVAILSCNQGNSAAESILLTARLPDGLLMDHIDAARVRMVEAERANDAKALFESIARPAGEVFFDPAEGVVRGEMNAGRVLEPDTCLALIFDVKRSEAFAPETAVAEIKAAVQPYTGRDGAQARIYSGTNAGVVRFTLPPILFGPVSEKTIGETRLITHDLELEIPAAAGPHRLDLSLTSSAGLNWTPLLLDEKGVERPWANGTQLPAGVIKRFRFEAPNPVKLPLGWVDTTLVRAVAFSENGSAVSASTRLITRRSEAPGGRISVTKTMALDRDCDGDLADERIQDALYEPVKDASPGDCVIFHIHFRHAGDKSMERIVVRDRVPVGTALRPGAVQVLLTPEPLQDSETSTPDDSSRDVVWSFEGLFEPGVEGEVSYAVRLTDRPK